MIQDEIQRLADCLGRRVEYRDRSQRVFASPREGREKYPPLKEQEMPDAFGGPGAEGEGGAPLDEERE